MSSPLRQELAALAERYALPEGAVKQLRHVLDALERDEHAPTPVREPHEALRVHLADSLAGLELEELRGADRVADIGAGAGFPGLALAIALPGTEVTLVESNARKAAFIVATADGAGLANVAVAAERAEEWDDGFGSCTIVTARALAPLGVLAEYAAPLLRDGGALVAWKGRRDPEEEAIAAVAADQLGLVMEEVRAVHPFAGADHRHLHVLRKVAPTPSRFPRRAGMATKRPLGAPKSPPSDRARR